MDTPKMCIHSECIHSDLDISSLKHLLNHRRHMFPLQTIKTASNPEKDKTPPLAVMKESCKVLFPLYLWAASNHSIKTGHLISHTQTPQKESGSRFLLSHPRLFLDRSSIQQLYISFAHKVSSYFILHLELCSSAMTPDYPSTSTDANWLWINRKNCTYDNGMWKKKKKKVRGTRSMQNKRDLKWHAGCNPAVRSL